MSGKIKVDLGNVQKTMLLPLWGRAVETQKAQPLLKDPVAVSIINSIDYDMSVIAKNVNPLSMYAWILRSLYMDRKVSDFLKRFPDAAVVNIGCGLDTTFDRIDNGHCRWFDLDLPDAIELRSKFIKESARRKFIAQSMLDFSWINIVKNYKHVCFIIAGVLYYLKEQQVKDFFKAVADNFPDSEAFFDLSSRFGVRAANKMVIKAGGMDEKSFLAWGLDNPAELCAWDKRIEIVEVKDYFKGHKSALSFKYKLLATLSDIKKIQYLVHLKFMES